MKRAKQIGEEKELEIMREHMFSPEEQYVLGHLKTFNRRASEEWAEDSPEFSYVLEEE